MKNYREVADSVFARRDQYVIQQRKKKQAITRATVSVGSVALVSLAGFALLRSDVFRTAPSITDGVTTTTTAVQLPDTDSTTTTPTTSASSVAQDVDTTASDTDAGKTQSPEKTTVPSNTQSPPTTAPSQTQPSKTTVSVTPSTTTPTQGKILIMADKPDYYDAWVSDEEISRNRVYMSSMLQETMEQYKDVNAVYFVIVELPATMEDYDEFLPTEELLQLEKEEKIAYQEFLVAKEEAGGYTPEVWEKRNIYRTLASKCSSLKEELMREHIQAILMQRADELAGWSNRELVSLSDDTRFQPILAYDSNYAFLMELTADEIQELAERGGYVIRMACPDGEEDWIMNDGSW